MLKRCQVLLTDWLSEYAKFISETYDMSFSEAVRVLMCLGAIQAVSELKPQVKPNLHLKKIVKSFKKRGNDKLRVEKFHRSLSFIYHETRKAIEIRLKGKN